MLSAGKGPDPILQRSGALPSQAASPSTDSRKRRAQDHLRCVISRFIISAPPPAVYIIAKKPHLLLQKSELWSHCGLWIHEHHSGPRFSHQE